MRASSGASSGKSTNYDIYAASLRIHAHELIWMGYKRMKPQARYATVDEPEITGELVQAMHDAMQDDDALDWTIHYELPKDDPPLNAQGLRGKHRSRVDMEFVRICPGIRPRLRFEAKRLGPKNPVTEYLGKKGMGCFLSGQYPATHGEAGMLGYVQSHNEQFWANEIKTELAKKKKKKQYAIRKDGPWTQVSILASLTHTYRSRHNRKSLPPVTILHVLLRFC